MHGERRTGSGTEIDLGIETGTGTETETENVPETGKGTEITAHPQARSTGQCNVSNMLQLCCKP